MNNVDVGGAVWLDAALTQLATQAIRVVYLEADQMEDAALEVAQKIVYLRGQLRKVNLEGHGRTTESTRNDQI